MDSSAETGYGAHEQCDSDSSDNSMENMFPDLSLVLFGNSSSVKFGPENILLGEKQMNMENAAILRINPLQREISEHNVSVINMTDLHETEHVDHLIGQKVFENEVHAFIFVVQLGQLSNDDKMALDWLQSVFGDKVLQFVMFLFTYEREVSDTVIDNLKKNPVLEQLLEKCGGGYHTCNKMMNNQSEMRELMNKIDHLLALRQRENLKYSTLQSGHSSKIPNAQLNLFLLGKVRAGKTASGNTILGQQAFKSKKSSKSVTQDVDVESGTVDGIPVTVYDTPGFCDPKLSEYEVQQIVKKAIQKCESGPCVFLLVIKADSFTKEERKTVEKIEELLGQDCLDKTWILFTRGDELEEENKTIKEFINETEALKNVIQKYDERYHVFNNKDGGSSDQVRILLTKIFQRYKDGGTLTRWIPDSRANARVEPDAPVSSLSSRRIVLLGKTGFGKSASGNTILQQKEFISEISSKSITRGCSVKHATVSGKSVFVVDTPGFFDTKMKQKHLMKEIAKSVYLSSPGPHAFLIVLRTNDRFTEHEQQIPQLIEILFGQKVLKYSIILFTHGDRLEGKSIETIIEENSALRDLVQQCGNRYHVFNNKNMNNREQVNDLLKKIDSMIEQNGGGHYSNQMFEDAYRFRQQEEERKQREEEQRKQEKQRQKIESVREKAEEVEAPKQPNIERQRENPEFKQFFKKHRTYWHMVAFALRHMATGELIGACIGGALGLIGGPAGVAAGVCVGTVIGAAVGVTVGAVKARLNK